MKYEPGDVCPNCGHGELAVTPTEECCTCHISPPCMSCSFPKVECDFCGYEPWRGENGVRKDN